MTLDVVALALAAIALWRSDSRRRALGLLAALLMAVAAASLPLFGDGRTTALLRSLVAVDATGLAFLNTIAAMVLVSLVLAVAAQPRIPALLVAGAGVWLAWPLVHVVVPAHVVGIAAVIVAVSSLGWVALVRLRPGRILIALDQMLDRRGPDPMGGVVWPPDAPVLAAGAFAVAALGIPHLWTALGGTALALVALWATRSRTGRRHQILLVAAALVVLALLWSVRLSGPLGGWIPALVDGPFSPRAALLLGAMVAPAALIVAGAWPLHGVAIPVAIAPLVIPLVGTFGTLLIPDGLRYWQPLLAPLTLLGMMHSVALRRADTLLLGGGLLGFWTGMVVGAGGGLLLVLSAWTMMMVRTMWEGRIAVPPAVGRLAQLVPVAGAILVLRGHLATEVGYALIGTVVVAVALGLGAAPHAPAPAAAPVAPGG